MRYVAWSATLSDHATYSIATTGAPKCDGPLKIDSADGVAAYDAATKKDQIIGHCSTTTSGAIASSCDFATTANKTHMAMARLFNIIKYNTV